jgi:hypothetical protein
VTGTAFARYVQFAKKHGLGRAAYGVVRAAIATLRLRRFFNLCIVEIFHLRIDAMRRDARIPHAFVVRFAGVDDLRSLQSFTGKPAETLQRLQRGDRCMVLLSGSEISATEWACYGPNRYVEDWKELRTVFRIPAQACWLFDGSGKQPGAWGSLMARLPHLLEESNASEVYLQSDWANIPSTQSHAKLGFRVVGRVFHLAVAGLSIRRFRTSDGRWTALPGRILDLEISGELA